MYKLKLGAVQRIRMENSVERAHCISLPQKQRGRAFTTHLPNFMDYEAVYLPKNHFILKEIMSTKGYLNLFFTFDKLNVAKRGVESMWNMQNDRVMAALAMKMSDKPMAVNMSFQMEYTERYEWIRQRFTDLAFTYYTAMLYYEDYDKTPPEERLLLQHGMEAFGGIAPTYRIALLDKPTIGFSFAYA